MNVSLYDSNSKAVLFAVPPANFAVVVVFLDRIARNGVAPRGWKVVAGPRILTNSVYRMFMAWVCIVSPVEFLFFIRFRRSTISLVWRMLKSAS